MYPDHRALRSLPTDGPMRPADLRLLEQIRGGDPDAGHRFIQEHYPGVYRYLLYLTGSPDAAEDLTQETFLQAWRRLETFEGRSALRTWLHRIAHREFLQALRSQRLHVSLEDAGEVPELRAIELTEAVELRAILGTLPVEERELVMLHYLEGYPYEEIAHILGIPVGRVRHRLSEARSRLQQELGEGDLIYLNEQGTTMRPWAWLPLEQMYALETRLRRAGHGGDDFASHEAPGSTAAGDKAGSPGGARQRETDIVDGRLTRKVTLAFKATALADVCDRLRADTGVYLTAGPSVADEKVTLFCRQKPVRDVMRSLSRPFGYTWRRSGEEPAYRYELVQELRSQLLEDELRLRDRNAALLALEREMERYRPYLDLSPDEALARIKTAPPDEQPLFHHLATYGWGPIHLYFRLAPDLMAALRDGQTLYFSEAPGTSGHLLPSDLARGVIESSRQCRAIQDADGLRFTRDLTDPRGLPLTAVPEVRAHLRISIEENELGQFSFSGDAGCFLPGRRGSFLNSDVPFAAGRSAAALKPQNAITNARLANDAALRARVSVRPQGAAEPPSGATHPSDAVLEALHQATGLPIVADHYTHLYPPAEVSTSDEPLFHALNHLADAMCLRWMKDEDWLQFRSTSFFHNRRKEVPNRLLARWTAARQEQGYLTLHDLVEIARLSDAQLDAVDMAEGAREQWGLAEWDLARNSMLRPHLRYLAGFTPAQREAAMGPAGLPLAEMSLAQQQQFLSFAFDEEADGIRSLEELAGATLRVDYVQPGWYEWRAAGVDWFRWVVPGEPGRRALWSPIRERTPEAALEAAGRVDPQLLHAMLAVARRVDPRIQEAQFLPHEARILTASEDPQILKAHFAPPKSQLIRTERELHVIYISGMSHNSIVQVFRPGGNWDFQRTE
jgi:RNA polymerase sigma-70 factor, ECF subfamily